jgi:hypothetical protein
LNLISQPPSASGSIENRRKDEIMKTGKRIVAAAFGGALCLATNTGLSAEESGSPLTMAPFMAKSLDAGTKHVVSYFLNADGQCKLTLMISDASRGESDEPSAEILRLRLTVEPRKAAMVDTTHGKLLRFACESDARAMSVTLSERVADGRDATE